MDYIGKHPRSGVYRFRRPVPPDLQATIGKKEIIKTLRTRDEREAKKLSLPFIIETDQLFAVVRSGLQAEHSQTAATWLDDLWKRAGAEPPRLGFNPLAAAPLVRMVRAVRQDASAMAVEAVPQAVQEASTAVPAPSPTPVGGPKSIAEIFALYNQEKATTEKISAEWERALRLFCEISNITLETPITSINRAMIRDFRQAAAFIPWRFSDPKYKGKTIKQLVEMARQDKSIRTISSKSLNKFITGLNSIFNYAAKNDYISQNPVSGMNKTERRSATPARLPYETSDLKAIFRDKLFKQAEWNEKQWIPLIALFSGCRLEEIGQLLTADIQTERGTIFFYIRTIDEFGNATKRVKSHSSLRKVPVHKSLIDLGFLCYLKDVKNKGNERLFPNLKTNKYNHTNNFSKWWGRQRDTFGIQNTKKTFHSFRHSFKDACRNAGLSEELHDTLTGHASQSVGRGYGSGYTTQALKEAINKIEYDVDIVKTIRPHAD